MPGGCAIGARPIDLHLKAFEALGAKLKLLKIMYMLMPRKDLKALKFIWIFQVWGLQRM